jgi:hypothetical protein
VEESSRLSAESSPDIVESAAESRSVVFEDPSEDPLFDFDVESATAGAD